MTREDIEELQNDIAMLICQILQNFEYSMQEQPLYDDESIYYRIYENVRNLLESTLSGEVLVCGPGAWLEARCIPGHDACIRFFIIYDDQEAFCIDLSPYYILDIEPDPVEMRELIKIDPLPRTILNKILEKGGEC